MIFGPILIPQREAKKGEEIFVDMAPDKPEEKAPQGNPSRPVGPTAPEPPRPAAPKAAEPKVRVAEAPRPAPPAPRPAPAPAPPQQVAKAAEPPPPAPRDPEPSAAPTPSPAAPAAPREPAETTRPASPPSPPASAGPLTAKSSSGIDLPAAMLRRPPGGGLQSGRGGVEGEPIPLDTPDPKYQDYFKILRERIQSKWTYPREAGDRGIGGSLLIEFHIAKDGRLAFLEVRRSSGVEILDEYAVNAIKLAQPFPPVPDNLAKQVLAINGNFVYQIIENSLVKQFTR